MTFVAISALKWRHAGQACITANRIYVQRGVYEDFIKIMSETGTKLKVGRKTHVNKDENATALFKKPIAGAKTH